MAPVFLPLGLHNIYINEFGALLLWTSKDSKMSTMQKITRFYLPRLFLEMICMHICILSDECLYDFCLYRRVTTRSSFSRVACTHGYLKLKQLLSLDEWCSPGLLTSRSRILLTWNLLLFV